MLKNLFKKKEKQTMNDVIDEIHESFYTEVDRLLESAKILKSVDSHKEQLIEKSQRLQKIGFHNSKEVKEAKEEIFRIEKIKTENKQNQTLTEAINYFSFKYPNYKFITKQSVEKICEKYNLIYSTIDNYIGDVPDENLKHIEDFKIEAIDEYYENYYDTYGDYLLDDFGSVSEILREPRKFTVKSPLEICAPTKDFKLENSQIKNFKLEIPDPIVLKPVIYKNQKYYLIVTAWGQEATDNLVFNPKHN